MYLFLLTLLTILAFQFIQFLYVLSQSVTGRLAGTAIITNSIGMGPTLFQIYLNGTEWRVGLLPLGGSTKFVNEESLLENSFFLTEEDPIQPLYSLPVFSRALILLVGPCSNIVLGLILLWSATFFNGSKVVVAPDAGTLISPSAVPELAWKNEKANWDSQNTLIKKSFLTYWYRFFTFQSLTGWGGIMGCMVTCAAALSQSPPAWLTCFGIICLGTGCLNLLPIPILNGGYFVFLLMEAVAGKKEMIRLITKCNYAGIVIVLFVMLRLLYCDITWCYSQFF
ncbi:site-2 protease family protein [uncultured Gimesia sp.]|uniref:site-2 protease family protein n=1 Tax=uncultured Gimesia sp. TaxID=1678688 RepID=UPI0030DA96C7|tara:strand:- start:45765 stop:46610 length:846 start_codon:yes stop_codon:yes gene_type:complete